MLGKRQAEHLVTEAARDIDAFYQHQIPLWPGTPPPRNTPRTGGGAPRRPAPRQPHGRTDERVVTAIEEAPRRRRGRSKGTIKRLEPLDTRIPDAGTGAARCPYRPRPPSTGSSTNSPGPPDTPTAPPARCPPPPAGGRSLRPWCCDRHHPAWTSWPSSTTAPPAAPNSRSPSTSPPAPSSPPSCAQAGTGRGIAHLRHHQRAAVPAPARPHRLRRHPPRAGRRNRGLLQRRPTAGPARRMARTTTASTRTCLPRKALTPNQMWAALIAVAGYVTLPLSGSDYLELLPVQAVSRRKPSPHAPVMPTGGRARPQQSHRVAGGGDAAHDPFRPWKPRRRARRTRRSPCTIAWEVILLAERAVHRRARSPTAGRSCAGDGRPRTRW